ncbi:MAG: DUF937 domain-containing protein [Bacteroidota bacterium]
MENQLMDLLQSQLGNQDFIGQLTKQIGGDNPVQTQAAIPGIVSTLMSAMAKNASTPEGANSLANALDRDHDGSILDDAMGMLSGQTQSGNAKMLNGAGILSHLLGGKQNGAIQMISQMSGLDQGKTGNLMTMLAPILMGALGKTKKQNGLDAGGILNLLTGSLSTQRKQSGTVGNQSLDMISAFLDQDGDGDVKDDLLKIGGKLLGGLFRRKR